MKKIGAIFLLAIILNFKTTAFAEVTRSSPDFHNSGHIRMWNQSVLNNFNPHILMIVLGCIIIAGISYFTFFKWKAKNEENKKQLDQEETAFRQLLAMQNATMKKVLDLEAAYEQGKITEEEYTEKINSYKQYLVKVKIGLRDYI